MNRYKSKFTENEIKSIEEVISFLFKRARKAEADLNSVRKNMFEREASKLSKVLYSNKKGE